jgi:NAD(P)H-dependent FMN reductase
MINIIVGTNRKKSLTKSIALYYQSLLNQKEIKNQIIDLSELPEDFAYSALYENAGKNLQFNKFQQVLDQNSKFVVIVPEYNGSFPGALKTFIDGLRYPNTFQNKKIALVGLSAGVQGGALALSHLTDIFHYLGAEVLSLKVKLALISSNFKEGKITHDFYNELLNQQIDKFLNF